MKKFQAIIVMAMLWVAVPSQAQIQFGLKGGLNVSKMSFDKDVIDGDNQTGFFVGPMVEVTLPVVGLGIDAALLYDNKSVKISDVYNGEDIDTKSTLQYLDIPINVKYTLGLGSVAGIYVATGPQFSFNIGHKNILKSTYSLKSSQFSWNVGAGVKLLKHLQIGYNYNIAIGKTAEVNEDGAVSTATSTLWNTISGDMKNNTHQISVAYLF